MPSFLFSAHRATPHDPRLTPLHIICLPAFRHITQILLDLRQQACVEFRQSDENLDGVSDAQGSCGVALVISSGYHRLSVMQADKQQLSLGISLAVVFGKSPLDDNGVYIRSFIIVIL